MAQFEKVVNSPFSNPKDGFDKCIQVLPEIGVEVWKKREIANLLLCKKSINGEEVQCNIMFTFDGSISIALDSQSENEEALAALAEEISQTLLK